MPPLMRGPRGCSRRFPAVFPRSGESRHQPRVLGRLLTGRFRFGRLGGRRLGCALLTLSLLGELAGVTAEIGARHVRCAEHGELTHLPDQPQGAAVWPSSSTTLPRVRAANVPGTGHDHCFLTALAQRAGRIARNQTAIAVPAVAVASLRWGNPATPDVRRPPLEAAPKTSPPRGA